MQTQSRLKYLTTLGLLTAAYIVAGKFGLKLAQIHPSASSVWAPTGIALAAFLCLGFRVWPAIALGAFAVNITTAGSILTSLAIAGGNTFEGLVGAYLVNRFSTGRHTFDQPKGVLKFVLFAALLGTLVSPTLGVTSLILGGFAPRAGFEGIWLTWWFGDIAGALLVAPLLILWSQKGHVRWNRFKILEVAFVTVSLFYLGMVVFDGAAFFGSQRYPLEFICIPPIIWTAYRFGERETATATFILSIIAIWGTLEGFGPFARTSPDHSLLLLQTFMAVISVTGLVLSALVSERDRGEAALEAANNDLELRVEERTISLAQTIADLKNEIAERREIEKNLRDSTERFGLLVEAVKDYAIFMLDPQGKVVSWNAGAERIKGYKAEEIIGRHFSLFYLPEDIAKGKPQQALEQAIAEGQSGGIGHRLRKDGSVFWADVIMTALFDKTGELRGFAKVTRDVTERHEAEKKIQMYSDIVSNMQMGVAVVKMDDPKDEKTLRLIASNPAASQVTGTDIGTMVGKTLWEGFPDLYKTPVPRQLAEVMHSGQPMDFGEFHYGDARVKEGIFVLKAFPLPDDCVGVIFENVTERKQAEKALSDSEERFRQLVNSNIIGFTLVDRQGRLLEANDAFLKVLGYSRSDLKAHPLDEQMITAPSFHSMNQWMLERVDAIGMCPPMEKELVRKDGCRIPVLVGMVQLRGTDRHRLCFVIDVTERRAAQDAMRKAYDELEVRVQQRTAELQEEVMRRERVETELKNQAIRDSLTGLYNRRGFMMLAEHQLQLARRQKTPLVLFMGDLDDLKQINDKFGHAEGDYALTRIGELLGKAFRHSDVVARIGGDEFAVAAIEEPGHTEMNLMERLQHDIDEYNRSSGRPYRIGLSLGTARIAPDATGTLEVLMQKADTMLYEQKKQKDPSPISQNPRH